MYSRRLYGGGPIAPDSTPKHHKEDQLQHAEIEVRGIVQNVNFRMTFKRVAYRLKLRGMIWNDPGDEDLVYITVEGKRSSLDEFVRQIEELKIRSHHEGEMAPFFSLIEVDTIKVDRVTISEFQIKKKSFQILRPEIEGAERVHVEILKKISSGGVVYQQFHNDHNRNFHTLERKFGAVSEGIEHANKSIDGLGDHLTKAVSDLVKWMKIGIFTLVGTGVVYILVRASIG